MRKTVVAIRHLAFEDLGTFGPALALAGFDIRYWDIGVDDLSALDSAGPDLLVVLGGPIGVYEEEKYPFLREELRIIRERLHAQRPIVGICLGAQLIAHALGEKVYPGPEKEIGFAPITLSEAGEASCLSELEGLPMLHWHGDTFDLPQGATLLASTKICANQAFSLGDYAIAFQFHPEAGEEGFERWLIGHTGELAAAGKDVCSLREEYRILTPELRARGTACLNRWLRSARLL